MANFEFCLQPDLTGPFHSWKYWGNLTLTVTVKLCFKRTDNMIFSAAFPDKYCVDEVTRSGVWIRTRIIRAEAMSWRWPTSGSGQSREKVATRWAAAGYSRQYHNWRTTRGTQLNNIFTQHPNIFSGAEFLKNMFGASHFYWWCSLI